jgi:hypothetical protein
MKFMLPRRISLPGFAIVCSGWLHFRTLNFFRAQAMRLPTYDKPRIINCAEDHPKHFALPRGCLDEVQQALQAVKIKPVVRDERCGGTPLNVSFCGHVAARTASGGKGNAGARHRCSGRHDGFW